MTEALTYDRSDQRAEPYQAAIMFEAGPGLREVILATVNDRAREAIGSRALALTSDTLVFANQYRFETFSEATLKPFVRQKIGSGRIALRNDVTMEETYVGREAVQMVFSPSEEIKIALAGLYGRTMEQLRSDDGYLASAVRSRKRQAPGYLSLTLSKNHFPDIPTGAAARDASWRMEAERREHGAPFVRNPQIRTSPVR